MIDTLMIGTYHTVRRMFMEQHVKQAQAIQAKKLALNPSSNVPLVVEPLSMGEVLISGTLAGWASCVVVTPFEQVCLPPPPLFPAHFRISAFFREFSKLIRNYVYSLNLCR